ncbi:C40 family peptidase [Nocardioides sp.]|uniref:C40 family peptidase n=1 Tax=Nocardioides sp. TaxID=35761 RepID=UPI002BE3F62D|nr:C40 family peptidase [Nocardioides sp.]HSX68537.1 C40 family peptidase [Nocardioides sp.]
MPAISRMRSVLALPFVLLVLLAGLVATDVSTAPEASATLTRVEKIRLGVKIARNQIGDPYAYGAAGPGRFDCSGLIYYSMRKAGIAVPRSSGAQADYARPIAKSNMRIGDLMYFGGHIAIFVGWKDGHRLMLDSPKSGDHVRIRRPWTTSWSAYTLR